LIQKVGDFNEQHITKRNSNRRPYSLLSWRSRFYFLDISFNQGFFVKENTQELVRERLTGSN
jgi:hypothetical protein